MTTPKSPYQAVTPDDEAAAINNLRAMFVGTKQLAKQPGVVYALQQARAGVPDVQAIDQFMQAMDLEKQVRLHMANGTKMLIDPTQQMLLDNLGVDYTGVQFSHQDAVNAVAGQITNAGGTVARNPDGSLKLDKNGNIVTTEHVKAGALNIDVPTAAVKVDSNQATGNVQAAQVAPDLGDQGKYVAKGVGRLFHTLNNDILKPVERNVLKPVLSAVSKPLNWMQYGISTFADTHTIYDQPSDIQRAEMQADGYDPNSFWSRQAYIFSGKAHHDLTPLAKQYGEQAVLDAVNYLHDPKGFRQQIENDPNSYMKNADGRQVLTPAAADSLRRLTSPEFETVLKRVQGQDATIGNTVLNTVGLDPVKHAEAYNLAAAGINLASAFMIDPTLIAGKATRGFKLDQVGMETMSDSNAVANYLTGTGPDLFGVRRRWSDAIEKAKNIRAAHDAGDMDQAAKLTAQFAAQHKELEPVLADMVGIRRFDGIREVKPGEVEPVFSNGPAWENLHDAADWMASRAGMTRIMNGHAAWNSPFMPGAVSNLGLRWLKGKTAGWMTERSLARRNESYADAVKSLEANTSLANEWESKGLLTRFTASPASAADAYSGDVLVETPKEATATMPSAERGQIALTPKGQGEVVRNVRTTGTPLGETGGKARPTAVAARQRLVAQRLSTQLPRNTLFDLDDPNLSEKVRKFALTFLNRGDANTVAAAINTADEGTRSAILRGLWDQLAHASGLTQTDTGMRLYKEAKVANQAYSSVGDEILINGQPSALWEGQVRRVYQYPSFREMQKTAAKIGWWDATMGRALTSDQADMLMSQWKMNVLGRPATVTRNQVEGWGRTIIEGRAGDAVKAKLIATTPNKELWAHGIGVDDLETFRQQRGMAETLRSELAGGGLSREQRVEKTTQLREAERQMGLLENRPIVQHGLALEAGDLDRAKAIENGSMMHGQQIGRTKLGMKTAGFLAPISRAYRTVYGRFMNPAEVEAIVDFGADRLASSLRRYGEQIGEAEYGMRNGARQATEIGEAGIGPSRLKAAAVYGWEKAGKRAKETKLTGRWAQQELEGVVGAERYANALAQRVNAQPDVARAIMDHAEGREGASLDTVVQALEASKRHTAFGSTTWDEGNLEARKALTQPEIDLGKREWAQRNVDDLLHLLNGQNGRYQQELADFIREEGKAPDAEWISRKLTGDNRPESALAPEVIAEPVGEGPFMQRILDVEGEVYQWGVERLLQRTTTGPVFLAHYAKERVALNRYVDQLIEQGITREGAENLARDLAEKNAMIRAEQLVDDPGQKTQFDVIARNIFPFSRATQAMIRRWGSGLWQDPSRARKLMLAYEGAVHSGFVYQNAYGEPTFTYPGSGVMNMMLRELAKVPGFESFAYFPVSSSMTGGVLMSVPGADNPLRMSMGPMIAIPMREIFKHVFPSSMRSSLDKFDEFVNGPIGVGQTWSALVPTAVRKFYVGMNTDERNSALASATVGAIANLAAAGMVPPPDAPDTVRQEFFDRIKTQVRNQLYIRAIFGLVAPAAPSAPTEGTKASQADYAFHIQGVGQLSDEYKAVLNDVKGDVGKANAVWNVLHPDEFVYKPDGTLVTAKYAGSAYETGRSHNAATKAGLAPTQAAYQWMVQNEGFIKKYGKVAAYFLPQATQNGPFSEQAYKTELELGLRQRKTPGEFLDDLQVRHAENIFYPAVKEFDAKIAAAKALGDDSTASQLEDAKSQWEQEFRSLNPLLQTKLDSYPSGRNDALHQVANLKQMLANGEVPGGNASLLSKLIKNYEGYEAFIHANKGGDEASIQIRRQALAAFNGWVQANVAGTQLADLYSGVFKVLNTNFVNIAPAGG